MSLFLESVLILLIFSFNRGTPRVFRMRGVFVAYRTYFCDSTHTLSPRQSCQCLLVLYLLACAFLYSHTCKYTCIDNYCYKRVQAVEYTHNLTYFSSLTFLGLSFCLAHSFVLLSFARRQFFTIIAEMQLCTTFTKCCHFSFSYKLFCFVIFCTKVRSHISGFY